VRGNVDGMQHSLGKGGPKKQIIKKLEDQGAVSRPSQEHAPSLGGESKRTTDALGRRNVS